MKIVTNSWGWNLKGICTWISYSWDFKLQIWWIETPPTKCYKFLCFCWKHSVKPDSMITRCPLCKTDIYFDYDETIKYKCKNGHKFKKPVYK